MSEVYADPSQLFTLASTIRTRMVDWYTANGWTMPARRYVATGTPAFDCELLAVQVRNAGPHQGNAAVDAVDVTGLAIGLRYAAVAVSIARCMPTPDARGNPPPVTDEEAASAEVYADGTRMWNGILDMVHNGYLPGCNSVAMLGWTNLDNGGGIGGGTLEVRVNLAGW